jgi:peroxiredoxin
MLVSNETEVPVTKAPVTKKIETVANVAIIIAALVLIVAFVRNFTANSDSRHRISVGKRFSLEGVNWKSNNMNIVLVVSTNCHFCSESAGFYRQLVEQSKQQHARIIAVLPQPASEATSYLKNEGVEPDEIWQATLSDLEISGTPTVLLVDNTGVVRSVWFGKLPDKKEKEVIAKLSL